MTELLGVQKAALAASYNKLGFGYFLEMGLGKTFLTLTDFMQLVEQKEATRLVVVCPNSFKGGWVSEIRKQKIDVEPWIFESGANNAEFLRRNFDRPPVLVINYEAIRRPDSFDFVLKFVKGRDAMIVFDESIQLKGNNTLQTKAAIQLAKAFKYARILSGKPITNGPHDLWGQMRSIKQLDGWNYYSFRNVFCRMGGFKMKKVVGAQNEELLGQTIDPHVFRATKDQWLDLPPKMYTIRNYSLTPEQRAQYNSMYNEFVTWLGEDENVSVDMAITKYIKLAQIQCGFIIDEAGKTRVLVEVSNNPRVALLREVLENEISGKVVVVYNHRYAGEILLSAFPEYCPTYIRGQMDNAEIVSNVKTFNEDPNCRIIFIQATAGRYGHTLVGGVEPENRCSAMIFFESTWSLDTRAQLEDRIHRIGQVGESCIYVDLVGTSLDQKVVIALQNKQSIFDAVFKHIKGTKH